MGGDVCTMYGNNRSTEYESYAIINFIFSSLLSFQGRRGIGQTLWGGSPVGRIDFFCKSTHPSQAPANVTLDSNVIFKANL